MNHMDTIISRYADLQEMDEDELWDKLFEISARYEFQFDPRPYVQINCWSTTSVTAILL